LSEVTLMSASIIASATRLYPELSEHESVFARLYISHHVFHPHQPPVSKHPRGSILIAHMVCHELKGFARRDSVQQAVEDVIQGRLRQVAEIMRSQNKAKTAFKKAINEAFRRVQLSSNSLKLGNGRSLQGTHGLNGSLSFHLSPMDLTDIGPDVAILGLTRLIPNFELCAGATSFTAPGSGTLILRDNGGGAYTADQ